MDDPRWSGEANASPVLVPTGLHFPPHQVSITTTGRIWPLPSAQLGAAALPVAGFLLGCVCRSVSCSNLTFPCQVPPLQAVFKQALLSERPVTLLMEERMLTANLTPVECAGGADMVLSAGWWTFPRGPATDLGPESG